MSVETNKLVGKAGRIGVPAGAALALVLAADDVLSSQRRSRGDERRAAPMDDNSVSSLVALDNAVEAVAARVSPAVVNIQVTSRGSAEHEVGGEQDQSQQGEAARVCLRGLLSSLGRTDRLAAGRCSVRSSRRLSMGSAAA